MTSTPGKTQVICFNFVSEWLMHEVSRPITYPELLSKTPILFYYDIPIHGTSHNFQSYTSYCKLKTALHLLKQFRLFLMKGYFNHIDITA